MSADHIGVMARELLRNNSCPMPPSSSLTMLIFFVPFLYAGKT
jgi:hypothetical protein